MIKQSLENINNVKFNGLSDKLCVIKNSFIL